MGNAEEFFRMESNFSKEVYNQILTDIQYPVKKCGEKIASFRKFSHFSMGQQSHINLITGIFSGATIFL